MKKQLAFVLGGGGSRGALQVGALRALFEAGYRPDLLIGTSIGAVNATYIAIRGASLDTIPELIEAWRDAIEADLLPANYLWLTVRALFGRPYGYSVNRMREFFIAHGLTADLSFGDIKDVRLAVVAADLNEGRVVLYGREPEQSVLEGVLASTALPPWVAPMEIDGRYLVDGGFISTLPIEPALSMGVSEIIALDLADPRDVPVETSGFGAFISRVFNVVEQRQLEMEMALAAALDVPVRRICLQGKEPVQIWDFRYTEELIEQGYEITRREIARWQSEPRSWWRFWQKK